MSIASRLARFAERQAEEHFRSHATLSYKSNIFWDIVYLATWWKQSSKPM